jgi:hypothetical protein
LKVQNVFIQLLLKVKITTKNRALKLLVWVKMKQNAQVKISQSLPNLITLTRGAGLGF